MSIISDVKRMLAPIRRKLFLLLGRALLAAVDNSEGTQKLQLTLLKDETITGVERFQEYGLETYPKDGAEALAVFLRGNRNQGIVLCVHDRRYRPTYLNEGEVCMYTDEDEPGATQRHRVHLLNNREIEIGGDDINIMADTYLGLKCDYLYFSADDLMAYFSDSMTIHCDEIALSGNWAMLRKLIDERFIALFNAHVHSGVVAGGANTGVPTVLMDAANHATSKVRAE